MLPPTPAQRSPWRRSHGEGRTAVRTSPGMCQTTAWSLGDFSGSWCKWPGPGSWAAWLRDARPWLAVGLPGAGTLGELGVWATVLPAPAWRPLRSRAEAGPQMGEPGCASFLSLLPQPQEDAVQECSGAFEGSAFGCGWSLPPVHWFLFLSHASPQ